MSILLKTVRVAGFRGLENIEVVLGQTTILTGMNNTGKTSFLKALELAMGNRQFVSQDDFFIQGSKVSKRIVIDVMIVPIDEDGNQCDDFSDSWEELFTTNRIRFSENESYVPLRTIISYDEIKNSYRTQQSILPSWPELVNGDVKWVDTENGTMTNFHSDDVPFFYMDALHSAISWRIQN